MMDEIFVDKFKMVQFYNQNYTYYAVEEIQANYV
jgi:hypothetical protein